MSGYEGSDIQGISIHALAKRATEASLTDFKVGLISIHALAKRATIALTAYLTPGTFQSTPSQRGRHGGGYRR